MTVVAPAEGDDATPSLLRVYVKVGSPFRRLEDFGPPASYEVKTQEFKLFVWPTTTMRTLCAQVHAAAPLALPLARHSLRVVFYDAKMGGYRARSYLHGIIRVSETGLKQLLGGDDLAKEIMSYGMPDNDRKGKSRQRDAENDHDAGAEEGVINSTTTVAELRLRDGDFLDLVIHNPGSGSAALIRSARAPMDGPPPGRHRGEGYHDRPRDQSGWGGRRDDDRDRMRRESSSRDEGRWGDSRRDDYAREGGWGGRDYDRSSGRGAGRYGRDSRGEDNPRLTGGWGDVPSRRSRSRSPDRSRNGHTRHSSEDRRRSLSPR